MIQYHDHHIIQQAAFTRLNTQTFGEVTRKNTFRLQPLNSVQDSFYLCFRTAADSRDIGQRPTKPACRLQRLGQRIGDHPVSRVKDRQINLAQHKLDKTFRTGLGKIGKRVPVGISRAAALFTAIIQRRRLISVFNIGVGGRVIRDGSAFGHVTVKAAVFGNSIRLAAAVIPGITGRAGASFGWYLVISIKFNERIIQRLFLKKGGNIQIRHLQQLDRLLQLGSHNKRLFLLDL